METIILTGAAGGLGKAFANACAARCWTLVMTDINEDALSKAAAGVRKQHGTEVRAIPCDMTQAQQRAHFWESMRQAEIRVGMLINVAGIDFEGEVREVAPESLILLLRLNIEAAVDNMRRVLALQTPGQPLHILNTSSLASFQPMPIKAAYAASKRFLLDFSRAFRAEMKGSGVTVTALCPAGMPTNRDCLESIASQGLIGLATTRNVGDVVEVALRAAIAGKALVIPGLVNQFVRLVSALLPKDLTASMIRRRWAQTRSRIPGRTAHGRIH